MPYVSQCNPCFFFPPRQRKGQEVRDGKTISQVLSLQNEANVSSMAKKTLWYRLPSNYDDLHFSSPSLPCKASSDKRTSRFGGDGCSCALKASTV